MIFEEVFFQHSTTKNTHLDQFLVKTCKAFFRVKILTLRTMAFLLVHRRRIYTSFAQISKLRRTSILANSTDDAEFGYDAKKS